MNGEEQTDPAPMVGEEQVAPALVDEPLAFRPEDMPPTLPGWELRSLAGANRLDYWNATLRLWVHVFPKDPFFRAPPDVDQPRCVLYRGFDDGSVLSRAMAFGDDFETVATAFTSTDERAWICEFWARRLGRSWRYDRPASDYGLSGDEKKAYVADMKRLVAISPDPYRDVRLAWWAIPEADRPSAA